MKIVLYSDEKEVPNIEADKKALELTGKAFKDIKFGYIPSVSDKTREHYNGTKSYWSKYGITEFYYADIDEEYVKIDLEKLKKCDIIYLSGGNTFKFNHNIFTKRFDIFLKEFASKGKVIIGVSAGSIVQTPTLESTYEYHKMIGDLEGLLPEDFNETTGLKLVNFEFIPHYDQGEKTEFLNDYISKKKTHNIIASEDGSAVIVDGDDITYFGKIHNFKKNN